MRAIAVALALLLLPQATWARDSKPKVVVMPLQANGIPPASVAVLDDLLANDVRRVGKYDVIGKSDIDAMLGLEKVKDQLGCDDVACAAQIGGALGADLLLAGRVAKLGDNIIVVLKLINARRPEVVGSVTHKAANDPNLYDRAIGDAVRELFGGKPSTQATAGAPALPVVSGVVRISSTPEGARIQLDGKVVGWTPMVIPTVSANRKHVVELETDGYLPRQRAFALAAAQTRDLQFTLSRKPSPATGWFADALVGGHTQIGASSGKHTSAFLPEAGLRAGRRFDSQFVVFADLRQARLSLFGTGANSNFVSAGFGAGYEMGLRWRLMPYLGLRWAMLENNVGMGQSDPTLRGERSDFYWVLDPGVTAAWLATASLEVRVGISLPTYLRLPQNTPHFTDFAYSLMLGMPAGAPNAAANQGRFYTRPTFWVSAALIVAGVVGTSLSIAAAAGSSTTTTAQ